MNPPQTHPGLPPTPLGTPGEAGTVPLWLLGCCSLTYPPPNQSPKDCTPHPSEPGCWSPQEPPMARPGQLWGQRGRAVLLPQCSAPRPSWSEFLGRTQPGKAGTVPGPAPASSRASGTGRGHLTPRCRRTCCPRGVPAHSYGEKLCCPQRGLGGSWGKELHLHLLRMVLGTPQTGRWGTALPGAATLPWTVPKKQHAGPSAVTPTPHLPFPPGWSRGGRTSWSWALNPISVAFCRLRGQGGVRTFVSPGRTFVSPGRTLLSPGRTLLSPGRGSAAGLECHLSGAPGDRRAAGGAASTPNFNETNKLIS